MQKKYCTDLLKFHLNVFDYSMKIFLGGMKHWSEMGSESPWNHKTRFD